VIAVLERLIARLSDLDCCPHPDLDEDTDAACQPADTAHADYPGSVTNGR
jgi:hypothetical protein